MSDAAITTILTELVQILNRKVGQEVRLVRGVDREVKKIQNTLSSIKGVLLDAEKKRVTQNAVKVWLDNLREVSYDIDDVLSEWQTAILKIKIDGIENASDPVKKVYSYISLPCFCVSRVVLRRDIALQLKDINSKLNTIAVDKDRYHLEVTEAQVTESQEIIKVPSYIDVSDVVGRDHEKAVLLSKLCDDTHQGVRVLSIVGAGGIGKTTLAQFAYNNDKVIDHYKKMIWVSVSQPFDDVRVAKAMVEDAAGDAPNLNELETLLKSLRRLLENTQFLIVLDDVWTEDTTKWEPIWKSLNVGAPGSKILLTTRSERVAEKWLSTYNVNLGILSDDDCWSIFSQIAFFKKTSGEIMELESIGKKIAAKCKGLPLAAKAMGGLMRVKHSKDDWQKVLESEIWKIEETAVVISRSLMLSYYDLPSAMKRCFSYCAIFPEDCTIDADNLIKLWMAHGYLSSRGNEELEDTGKEYLENLVMRSFFQHVKKDKDGLRVLSFKMHDLVRDFARKITEQECFLAEVDGPSENRMESITEKVRHLTMVRKEDFAFPSSTGDAKKLHTFWVQSFFDSPSLVSQVDKITPSLFDCLTRLKSLDLSRNRLSRLPTEIGKMINLKFLNLSYNPLSELPEAFGDLLNMQTLRLVGCNHLKRLPQNISRLELLRHLDIDNTISLEALPKGVGRLSCLRTLSRLIIKHRDSSLGSCGISDLKDLNLLHGCLKIEGLGYVDDAGEAEEADLKNKKHLSELTLDFNPVNMSNETKTTRVMEALQLHSKLQFLQISSYGGTEFPTWMACLPNLRRLHLQECQNLIQLPPLGRLPSLEVLYIENANGIKYAHSAFLGIESTTKPNGKAGVSSPALIAFPKLKKLKIAGLKDWEEWDMPTEDHGGQTISVMPYLRYLKISSCPKLKALPPPLLGSLKPTTKLRIHQCPVLRQKYERGNGSAQVSHVGKIRYS